MTNPFSTNPEEPNAQQPDARQPYGSGDQASQHEHDGLNDQGDRDGLQGSLSDSLHDGLNESQTQPPSFQPEYGQNPYAATVQPEAGAPAENPFNPGSSGVCVGVGRGLFLLVIGVRGVVG